MADEIKTPVAIRVARPYATDDDFLQHEIDTLTRTTVTLLGAQSRPQGVILRFEVTLATGAPILRGEGRVVAFRPASQGVDAGLTLRFTRLDARSKALVDRAASVREARARAASVHPPRLDSDTTPAPAGASLRPSQAAPPPIGPTFSRTPSQRAPDLALPPPPPLLARSPALSQAPAVLSQAPAGRVTLEFASSTSAPSPTVTPSRRASPSIKAPPSRRREELLDRLRQRVKTLSKAEVDALLASSRRKRPSADAQ